MPLTGTFERNLDDKSRLAIPKRLRDDFGEGELTALFVAPGVDRSLAIYSPATFERLASKLENLPTQREEVRAYLRLFYAQAEQQELDNQGRIRIPDRLVGMAGLSRSVVLLGVRDHIELWDGAQWQEYCTRLQGQFDSLAQFSVNTLLE